MRAIALLIAAAIASALALAGCTAIADDRPLVVVTTNILGDVVGTIVGDEAEVLVLMQPNVDPHSFEISAREAARIQGADLLVSNGLGLEEGLQQHVDAAVAAGVASVSAGDLIEVLSYSAGESEGQPDPHFWTDPTRMIAVVSGVAEAVVATVPGVDPTAIAANAASLQGDLHQLEEDMDAAFATIPAGHRNLVTNHHVFGYLADRFGFEVIGAVLPSGTTLAAPSASDLAGLATSIADAGVRTIFADSSQPDRLAQVLADEGGVDVAVVPLYTESLTAPGEGAHTYLLMMRANTERIATGLSP